MLVVYEDDWEKQNHPILSTGKLGYSEAEKNVEMKK